MFALIQHLVRASFRSRHGLILENIALRHQIEILERQQKRPRLKNLDRLFWVLLRRVWPDWRHVLFVVQPDTVVRWHRAGFHAYWRWKCRTKRRGRPRLTLDERSLIREMTRDNPTWGVPRIHGELLKLGIEMSPTTVGKYMGRTKPPSQTWKTFLKNHASEIVSIDFFTVPTITGQVLYVFLMIENASRRIVHFNVTAHPTATWTAMQIVQAFPWDRAPLYLLRDRDQIYNDYFSAQVRALGIEQVTTAARSPWQNPYVERLIGTIRRECLDHVIVLGDRHLRRILQSYVEYYHSSRTHLGLEKECPVPRAVEPPDIGPIRKRAMVGGLHHRYFRVAA